MNISVITQARVGSTRLPNKVLKKVLGKTLLEIHIERVKKSKLVDKIIIATTTNKSDNIICDLAKKLGVDYFKGSEYDVLDRFYQAVKNEKPNFIVRLTSDCPLIDPELIDNVLQNAIKLDLDYYSNTLIECFPDGQDIEVLKFKSLETAWENAKLNSEREHVTPYIRKNSSFNGGALFKSDTYKFHKNYKNVRLTVDEEKDFKVIDLLVKKIGLDKSWLDYTKLYLMDNKINSLNKNIIRNEGYLNSLKKD